ncbi:zinc-binding dehydrogenase [Nocardia arthritidis]|nr:zinc-binding dehydrogenase [Nocardia arthritidis]
MRALVSDADSGELTIGEVDAPTPGSGESLVRVAEFGLNRADYLYLRSGVAGFRPGVDAAGVVLAAAADGSGPEPGAAVAFHLPSGGAAAELVAVPSERLARVPDEVPAAVAAALPLAGLVAVRLLELAGPLAGATILGTGMGGGVGQLVIRLAVAGGARVLAVAESGQPVDHLVAAGAEVVTDIAAVPDGSVDVVLESVGGALGSAAAHKLRTAGLLLWFGQASGQPLSLDFFDILRAGQSLTLRQFVYGDNGRPDRDARELERLLVLVAGGELTVPIGHHRDWSHTARLLDDMAGGRLRGKAVLTVS